MHYAEKCSCVDNVGKKLWAKGLGCLAMEKGRRESWRRSTSSLKPGMFVLVMHTAWSLNTISLEMLLGIIDLVKWISTLKGCYLENP